MSFRWRLKLWKWEVTNLKWWREHAALVSGSHSSSQTGSPESNLSQTWVKPESNLGQTWVKPSSTKAKIWLKPGSSQLLYISFYFTLCHIAHIDNVQTYQEPGRPLKFKHTFSTTLWYWNTPMNGLISHPKSSITGKERLDDQYSFTSILIVLNQLILWHQGLTKRCDRSSLPRRTWCAGSRKGSSRRRRQTQQQLDVNIYDMYTEIYVTRYSFEIWDREISDMNKRDEYMRYEYQTQIWIWMWDEVWISEQARVSQIAEKNLS